MSKLKKILRNFVLTAPESVSEILWRAGVLIIIGILLLVAVKIIDGPNHRLGSITIHAAEVTR